jgi:hypothetical protein
MSEKQPYPDPRSIKEIQGEVRKTTVDTVVDAKELSLYQEAAARTGFNLSVVAREGQDYTYSIEKDNGEGSRQPRNIRKGEIVQVTRKLTPGEVAISVKAPQGRIDYATFWDAYRALKPTPPGKKG